MAPNSIRPSTRDRLRRVIDAAIAAADPASAIQRLLRTDGDTLLAGEERYDPADFDNITVVGAGKASARMAGSQKS